MLKSVIFLFLLIFSSSVFAEENALSGLIGKSKKNRVDSQPSNVTTSPSKQDLAILIKKLNKSDFNESKKILRLISDKEYKDNVVQLIIDQIHNDPSFGISLAIFIFYDEISIPLISELGNPKTQKNAAYYLRKLGKMSLPYLKKYTADKKLGRIVSQIIDTIYLKKYPTFYDTFISNKKNSVDSKSHDIDMVIQSGHSGSIIDYVVTYKDENLITLGSDGYLKYWDINTLTLLWEKNTNQSSPLEVFYISNKKQIVVSFLGGMEFFDAGNGDLVMSVKTGRGLKGITQSNDERYLLGVSMGNITTDVIAFDLIKNELIIINELQYTEKSDEINSFHISFFADYIGESNIVIYGNKPDFDWKKVSPVYKYYDLDAHKEIDYKHPSFYNLYNVELSKSSSHQATYDKKEKKLKVFNTNNEIIFSIKSEEPASFSFQNDDFLIVNYMHFASNTNNKTLILDLANKKSININKSKSIYAPHVVVAKNNNGFFTLNLEGLRYYNFSTQNLIYDFPRITSGVICLDAAKDLLAVGYKDDNKVTLWSLSEAQPVHTIYTQHSGIIAAKFIPNSKQLLVVTNKGTVELWDYDKNELLTLWVGAYLRERSLSISPNGKYFVIRGDLKKVDLTLSNIKQKKIIEKYKIKTIPMSGIGRMNTIRGVYFSTNIVNIYTSEIISTINDYNYDITSTHFIDNNHILLGGPGWYGKWSVATGENIYYIGTQKNDIPGYNSIKNNATDSITVNFSKELYTDFAIHPDYQSAYTSTSRNELISFNLVTGDENWKISYQGISGGMEWINSITINPDGSQLISSHSDGKVRIWNSNTGDLIDIIDISSSELIDSISIKGNLLYVASINSRVHLINLKEHQKIATFVYLKNDEWLIYSSNGYFYSSFEGDEYVSWVLNDNVYKLSSFSGVLKSKSKLQAVITLKERPKKLSISPPPILKKVAINNDKNELIINTTSKIDTIVLKNRNKIIFDGKPEKVGNNIYRLKNIDLGNYGKLLITGKTKKGVFTNIKYIEQVMPDKKSTSTLYLLSVGIDSYEFYPRLWSAEADAKSLAKSYSKSLSHWENVVIRTLTNKDATNENILSELKKIEKKSTTDDMVIIYFSGHGIRDLFDETKLLFATKTDTSQDNDLEINKILSIINNDDANILVIFDICHAATAKNSIPAITPDSITKSIFKSSTSFRPMVLFSSKARQTAIEYSEMKNGVFMQSFISGISGKADVSPRDGKVTYTEIYQYLKREVNIITNGKQTPYIPFIDAYPDLPIAYIDYKNTHYEK